MRSSMNGAPGNAALFVPPIEGEAKRVDIVGRGFVGVSSGDLRNRSGECHGLILEAGGGKRFARSANAHISESRYGAPGEDGRPNCDESDLGHPSLRGSPERERGR